MTHRHVATVPVILVLLAILAGTSRPAAAAYRGITLTYNDYFGPWRDSEAHGIADSGDIVGQLWSYDPTRPPQQVRWEWNGMWYENVLPAAIWDAAVRRSLDRVTGSPIGYIRPTPGGPAHAFYGQQCPRFSPTCWDIHPAAAHASEARGAAGGIVVGVLQRTSAAPVEAALWNGTSFAVRAGTYRSLHRPWWHHSAVAATNGLVHVGSGGTTLQEDHAFVWTYTDGPYEWWVTDLHPTGYGASHARDVDPYGNRIVGWATFPTGPGALYPHALVWHRSPCCPWNYFAYSALDYTDIHRSGLTWSKAYGVTGGAIVGVGNGVATGGERRALVWAHSTAPALDLQQFLPPQFVWSEAIAVNPAGVIVGNAYTVTGHKHAVAWHPATDVWLAHDAPVRSVTTLATSLTATGTVTLATAVTSATQLIVRAGPRAQTIIIPADQTQGRFELPLYFANDSPGTVRYQFTVERPSMGTSHAATLTVIRRSPSLGFRE